jgi:hypothetical protein
MKRYMVVLEHGKSREKKVVLIIETGQIDSHNVHVFAHEFSKEWCVNSKKYPAPQYDIVIGAWDDLKNAKQSMRDSYGWDNAPLEQFALEA